MNPWIETTGWTLIHFIWQGTLLALATAAALGLCRRSTAQVRYVVACLGLTSMLVTAAATAVKGTVPGGPGAFSLDRVPPAGRLGSPIRRIPRALRATAAHRERSGSASGKIRGNCSRSSCGSGWRG